jgi:hypothetical protein
MVVDFEAQITFVGLLGSAESPEIQAFAPLFAQVLRTRLLD